MRDYMHECNNLGVSEEDFQRIWCIRCVQQECHRSHQGKSRFEARVSTWEERLFTNVPRMPTSDPRYPDLANRAFVEPESWKSSQVQVPSSWDLSTPSKSLTETSGSAAETPGSAAETSGSAGPDLATLPSGFVASRVPHQSGKTLGDQVVLKPGGRIRFGGTKDSGGGGSSGVE